jgi:hypothetical protein
MVSLRHLLNASSTLAGEVFPEIVEFLGNLAGWIPGGWKCVGNKSQGMRLSVA